MDIKSEIIYYKNLFFLKTKNIESDYSWNKHCEYYDKLKRNGREMASFYGMISQGKKNFHKRTWMYRLEYVTEPNDFNHKAIGNLNTELREVALELGLKKIPLVELSSHNWVHIYEYDAGECNAQKNKLSLKLVS